MRIRPTAVVCVVVSLMLWAWPSAGSAQAWQAYVDPAEAGFSAAGLARVRTLAEGIGSAGVMLVYRGHVVVAWGDVERPFKCHSVRKSLLAVLLGPYVEAGEIDLDQPLAELGVDDLEPLSDTERTATVRDLLASRSGVYHPAARETLAQKRGRPERGAHAPGAFWWYNNWDFNVLASLFEQETGEGMFHAFQRRVAEPIGMEDFRLEHGRYQLEPGRSRYPGWAIRLSTRDRARVGQLMLEEGRWGERQVVPSGWVEQVTQPLSKVSESRGYGLMWWTYDLTGHPALGDLAGFAAVGSGGQLILVVPAEDMVVVHSANTDAGRAVSEDAIWRLVAALRNARTGTAAESPRLGTLRADPLGPPDPPLAERRRVHLTPSYLERFVGSYTLGNGLVAEVQLYCCRLLLTAEPLGEMLLVPMSESAFFRPGENLALDFVLTEDGRVVGLELDLHGRRLKGVRLE